MQNSVVFFKFMFSFLTFNIIPLSFKGHKEDSTYRKHSQQIGAAEFPLLRTAHTNKQQLQLKKQKIKGQHKMRY
ncbi:hypothetical protein CWC31_12270 [Pseudoalteromonas ruthenica]|nr:hypothetical protein CWC31_12270 [Pseudoalteromonas ruthenica]